MKILLAVVLLTAMAISGCNQDMAADRKKHEANAQTAKSVTKDAVKTMAQYDKIIAGRKAADRIDKASASRAKDMDDLTSQME